MNTHDFRNFQTISTFAREIYNGTITLKKADKYQGDLLVEILSFRKQIKPKDKKKKTKTKKQTTKQKEDTLENLYNLFEGKEKGPNAFVSKTVPVKTKGTSFLNFDHSKLKILTPKQMLQRLPIAIAQVKPGNNSKSLLNEIRQIVYSLYESKEITKKVYSNIIKSIIV